MDRKRLIFQKFVQANSMGEVVDFSTREIKFLGELAPLGRTKNELEVSLEFAGFVDGYEGHPSKFKRKDNRFTELLSEIGSIMAHVGVEMLKNYEGTEQERYEAQYKLGFQSRTL